MAEIYNQTLLVAGPANTVGDTLECVGLANAYLEIITECTVANLSASITIGMGVEQAASYPPLNFGTLLNVATAGLSFSTATGTFTLLNIATGKTTTVYRFAAPARYMKPTWTYLSGGGTFSVRVVAWGWQTDTTP